MKKLKQLKNFHVGIGISIIILQILFHVSNIIYLFGILLILFSHCENRIIKDLITDKDNKEKVHEILVQYKWVNILIILPFVVLTLMFTSDIMPQKGVIETFYESPILWIDYLACFLIGAHFTTNRDISKIKQEISNY